jgi:3-deoxy-D-manno-octulosonic-acid transferase
MAYEILVYLVSWEITLFLLFLSFLKKKKKEIIRKSLAVTSPFNTSENQYVWFTLPNMF